MAKRLISGGWLQKWKRDKNRASLIFNAALIVRVFVTVSVRRWSCEFQFPLQCDVMLTLRAYDSAMMGIVPVRRRCVKTKNNGDKKRPKSGQRQYAVQERPMNGPRAVQTPSPHTMLWATMI